MFFAFCFKLKPSATQHNLMLKWLDMLRASYNFNLRDRIEAYEQVLAPILGNFSRLNNQGECCPLTCYVSRNSFLGEPWKNSKNTIKKRSAYEQQSSNLPLLKQQRPWYKTIHSTVLQQNLRRLDVAFANFFEQGKGYPKFKSRSKFRTFNYPPGQVKIKGDKVYLPSIGWIKFYQSRTIDRYLTLKTVTIKKKADGFYVSFRLEDQSIPNFYPLENKEIKSGVGCDLGIRKLLALSSGQIYANLSFFFFKERRHRIRSRAASRKKKNSKNRKYAYQYLAKLEQKIEQKRTDYHWKIAVELAKSYDLIVLEALKIKNMMARCKPKKDVAGGRYLKNGQGRKRGLNRVIGDAAWGELKLKIKAAAEKWGKIYLEVNPRHTSQQCSNCQEIDSASRKGEKYICTTCGHVDDADIQAGKNILNRGLHVLGVSPSQLRVVNPKVTSKRLSLPLGDELGNLQVRMAGSVMIQP
jgi:putative transposase